MGTRNRQWQQKLREDYSRFYAKYVVDVLAIYDTSVSKEQWFSGPRLGLSVSVSND